MSSTNKKDYIQVPSNTSAGMFSFFEKIIRSHPLLYLIVRNLVRFTNIFEDDAHGIKFIKFEKNLNVLDVGASDGIAAKFFLNNLSIKNIICFEPDKDYVKILKKLNKKIIVNPYAIGEKNQYVDVFYPEYNFLGKKIKFVTFCYYDKKILKKQIELDFKFRKKIKIIKRRLKIKKFNTTYMKIGLIKVDVNGFEYSVIKGIMKIIKKDRPALLLETGKETFKIKKLLNKYAYKQFIYSKKSKKFYKANNKYALNTYFLQKKHLN